MLERFETFLLSISQIQKDILRLKSLEMREFGLKGPHVMCLFCLARHPEGLTAAALCRHLSVDRAAVSRVLAALEHEGFVRYADPPQGRRYRAPAALTERGRAVAARIDARVEALVQRIGGDIPDGEREAMYRSLHTIAQNLDMLLRAEAAAARQEEP